MADHRDTIILPFEKGILEHPSGQERWVLLNASPLPDAEIKEALKCEQGFRSDYLALEKAGYAVEPNLEVVALLDGSLVLANRSRKVNERNFTRAWNATKPGGVVMFSGGKTSGVQPLRKWVGKKTDITGSISKHHALVFWVIKQGDDWPVEDHSANHDGYRVDAGMFSANGPDVGSRLLVECFDHRIRGKVADFGAGWGYLSAELLKRSERVDELSLFEADWVSLQAAKHNVGDEAQFHWRDLTQEAPRGPFDWIIMNPPFHTGRAADPRLGNLFIEAAAKALPSGGRLLMVANTNLPYEKTLEGLFRKVERKAQANGFKIIEAIKGS